MSNIETAQIIQFDAARPKRRPVANHTPSVAKNEEGWKAIIRAKRAKRQGKAREAEQDPTMKDTARNHRFRQTRRDAWRDAGRLTDFARARLEWHTSLQIAQSWSVPGSAEYPRCDDNRNEKVTAWRTALVEQMLTPAPDQGAVVWKRAQLRAGQHRHVGVKDETLQRAIDADVKWLEAHPSRKSIAASRQAEKD